jgi:hypothetical protein
MREYNRPFVWYTHPSYPNRLYAKYDWKVRKTDSYIFNKATPLDLGQHYDLILEIQKGSKAEIMKWDSLQNSFGSPIVNARTLEVLESFCSKNFQAFPVIIQAKDGVLEKHYWALNILATVDCIDPEKSLLEYWENSDSIYNIDKLEFKSSSMLVNHLCRVLNYMQMFVVSPELVKIFKQHKIRGPRFYRDDEVYNRYILPEDLLMEWYEQDPEEAQRRFVRVLCRDKEYNRFKAGLYKVPLAVLEDIINRTSAKTSMHKDQCDELLQLRRQIA